MKAAGKDCTSGAVSLLGFFAIFSAILLAQNARKEPCEYALSLVAVLRWRIRSASKPRYSVVSLMLWVKDLELDGASLSQPQPPPPPPPPPHDQQQPSQIDPADPPQQGDNVERETQEWLTRDEQLGDT
ncbi:hypothetical protein Syun_017065 [Stephania yunnanensis]|uniref:Uncharacterized protein n=1 Tax=Stephania yunnanensis TaxID=152371 RepID=A0AAP0J8H1_9MAGN